MVALTSWQALKERAQTKPGQKVFIPAGAGGIGTFAIRLAKHLRTKVATTTSAGNKALVRSLGADEVIDYNQQQFEAVLRDYDAVLGTITGDSIKKSLQILKQKSNVVSLVGPPDAAFGRARGMNIFMVFVFGLLSRNIRRLARKRSVEYSFLFVEPKRGCLFCGFSHRPIDGNAFRERRDPVDGALPIRVSRILDHLGLAVRAIAFEEVSQRFFGDWPLQAH